MRIGLMTCLFVTMALAGCTGDEQGADVDGSTANTDGTMGVLDGRVMVQANLTATDPVVIEGSGSFMPPEALSLPPFFPDDLYRITDSLREDTVYRMEAVLSYQDTLVGVTPGPLYLDIDWEGDVVRDLEDIEYQESPDGDNQTMVATILPVSDGSWVELIVGMSADGWFGQPPRDYELVVTLTPVLDRVPQYGAAAVQVPAGGDLVVENLDGPGRVMVYRGSDEFVGVFDVDGPTTVINRTDAATEFIIITLDDIWAKVFVTQDPDAPAPVLRHVPYVMETEPIGSINGQGEQTVPFTLDDHEPARVGIRYGFGDEPGYTVVEAQYAVIGPDGEEQIDGGQNLCICIGWNTHTTWYDDGPMPLGDYTIEWSSTMTQNVDVYRVTYHPQP